MIYLCFYNFSYNNDFLREEFHAFELTYDKTIKDFKAVFIFEILEGCN